jgi:hypothetical protein
MTVYVDADHHTGDTFTRRSLLAIEIVVGTIII